MQSVCLDEFGGEKSVHPSSQETTLIQHIFGGHLQSQVKLPIIKIVSLAVIKIVLPFVVINVVLSSVCISCSTIDFLVCHYLGPGVVSDLA